MGMKPAAAKLDELYAAYAVPLNRYLCKLTRDPEEASDLAQESFLRLCQQESLPPNPKEWLFLTGYRLFVDHWRRRRRMTLLRFDSGKEPLSSAAPEQTVLDREFERQLEKLLLRFKAPMRTALYMRLFKSYPYGEIARRLRCSENTVKSFIRRGRKKLSEWL
ncbi:RNA polymerase sigma factor [Cohnella panacarvi]|uniref:RNA polymerase sigma factor n=1 Tax=Cohnella panacarvi TaxID=400776 RepID=UPI0004BABE87|nr:RNA polymerase sigma factor [Cohnella panacarvi]